MKIFGYEIKKVQKERTVIVDTQTYKPRVDIRLKGDGWGVLDHDEFCPVIIGHFTNLTNEITLPKMSTEQKVQILKIFYKDFCEFEII